MNPLVKFTQTRKWLSMLFSSVQANPEITFYYSVPTMNCNVCNDAVQNCNVCNDAVQHPIWAQRDKDIGVLVEIRGALLRWISHCALVHTPEQSQRADLISFQSIQPGAFPLCSHCRQAATLHVTGVGATQSNLPCPKCVSSSALFHSTDLLLLQCISYRCR